MGYDFLKNEHSFKKELINAQKAYDNAIKGIEKDIATMMIMHGYPITIGNTSYSVINNNVPAYFDTIKKAYMPIYDKECTYDYGWYNFEDCCNIYDVIKTAIECEEADKLAEKADNVAV